MHQPLPDPHQDAYSRTIFGFWLYLMTDFMMFAALFATYGVLQATADPHATESFHLFPPAAAFMQTLGLLGCSLTSGLGGAAAHRKDKGQTIFYFLLTFLMGFFFLWLGLYEWIRLIREGYRWDSTALLSAFYTLVGTHAVHMLFALLWTIVLLVPVARTHLNPIHVRRLTCLRMFWQFLYVVWLFIFSLIYLVGRA